jgi:hypothetical protein
MNTSLAITPRTGPRVAAAHPVQVPAPRAGFNTLCDGLRASGGLVDAEQLVGLMRGGARQPISQLARWIVARQVISLPWNAQTLLPRFQFTDDLAGLQPGWVAALAELGDVFDDWELAHWFASRNCALQGAVPADLVATRPMDVWQAARTDRYIATGG